MISNKDKPRFLYKYIGRSEYILDVITERRLYHALPSEFSDPFDCRPLLSLANSRCNDEEVWWKLLYYLSRMQCIINGVSEEHACRNAEYAFRNGRHKNREWLRQVDIELRGISDLNRVCCFSRTARNMMMWAHYAARHTGVVFQFRTRSLHDATSKEYRGHAVTYVKQGLGVVEYVKALEMGFDHDQPTEMARIILATKSKEWQEEEEIRFFADCSQKFLSFPEVALSGIIFGDKTSSPLVEDIHRVLDHWSIPPRLYRTSIKDSTHRLCIRKCGSSGDCDKPVIA